MPRNRVLSLFSRFENSLSGSPTSSPGPSSPQLPASEFQRLDADSLHKNAVASAEQVDNSGSYTPTHRRTASSAAGSRRNSLSGAYRPPMMDYADDTPPELQPIFTYLNSHTNKLYQEGYFLKLHDLDSRGKPSSDRVWNECFAQLVGTVLSLWDAAQLDAAGEDGEVIPTFINLTDASIRMIESLPMNGMSGQSLQNVLSISTAANNRYLLHFNSLHSLTQWTAGIRLAMFEHATLQEAYTGAILAAKGKQLNGIRNIMERNRFQVEDWARVRFGAGTPWRRCWCVIRQPDEKEIAKAQKLSKKRSAYDRSPVVVKGDIRFYETRKITKKTRPIATITDAYASYAIYPQSKPLIDQSTLVKVEGRITIHTNPETTTEGFVFVMPEVHPAVSGFEIMLRWLIPTFDTFALYGRPSRLIADVVDTRSLMFAMPSSKRYGYLELIDVAGLIHTEGSRRWSEREWRVQLKNLTAKRMAAPETSRADALGARRPASQSSSTLPTSGSRLSLNIPPSRNGIKFGDDGMARSGTAPSSRTGSPGPQGRYGQLQPPVRTDSAPPGTSPGRNHQRAASEMAGYKQKGPSRLSFESVDATAAPPPPPPHGGVRPPTQDNIEDRSSEDSKPDLQEPAMAATMEAPFDQPAVTPVVEPPSFIHGGQERPNVRPADMPDMRRANSAIDAATLAQLGEANLASRAFTGANARDDMYASGQIRPGLAVTSGNQTHPYGPPPHGPNGTNYNQPPNGYVGQPVWPITTPQINTPPPTNGPQSGYRQMPQQPNPAGMLEPPKRRTQPSPTPEARRLPTIPGTPAFEQSQFDLPVMQKQASITRKPVGSARSDSHSRSRSRGSEGRAPSPRG